jgi:hypothetical protein
MEKVEDISGQELRVGDYVTICSYNSIVFAQVYKFTESCMLCEYSGISYSGKKYKGRLQPYLPGHEMKSTNKKYPNRMINVYKITKDQYDNYRNSL